jgi:2-amino-4-hydroxy-6-hydroxymethyldihydropteridine diphosphokinase
VTQPVTAYIGLGSNLSDPQQQLEQACQALAAMPHSKLVGRSPLYRSKPMGPLAQPDYLNGVAVVNTTLAPHTLLDALQDIEASQGRVRSTERWGPRTLDLDLLLYGTQVICDERLTVPHPGLGQRNFVLYPLNEVTDDDMVIPGLGPLASLLLKCPSNGLELVA